jgi:hypothetical protein
MSFVLLEEIGPLSRIRGRNYWLGNSLYQDKFSENSVKFRAGRFSFLRLRCMKFVYVLTYIKFQYLPTSQKNTNLLKRKDQTLSGV